MSGLTPLRDKMGGMFDRDRDGKEITREATCLCGQKYTQRLLSERFMKLVEGAGSGAVDATMRDIPEMFVPLNCPPCEHRQLLPKPNASSWAIRRRQLSDRERFAENMARLFGAFNRPNDEPTVRAYWIALEWALTDDQFEEAVIGAIRNERKWPAPAVVAQYGKAA